MLFVSGCVLASLPANTSIWKLGKEMLSLKVWIWARRDNKKLRAVFLLNLNFGKIPRMHFQFYAVCECQICLAGTEFLESNYCHPIWLNIPINIPEVCKTKNCWYRLNTFGRQGYLRTGTLSLYHEFFCYVSYMSSLPNMFKWKEIKKVVYSEQIISKKQTKFGNEMSQSFNCFEGSENLENIFQSR